MSKIKLHENKDNSQEVSLELNDRVFADIILNFLGKKESLKYEDDISFIIRLNDLEQFYYLINEKISREHNIFIDHFLSSITYNDKTTRELSGIEQLNQFLETRDVIPLSVTLSWNIIIKYPKADTIENQKIELSFIKNNKIHESGFVVLVINHTNQSWGVEILNIIKNKIQEISIDDNKAYTFAKTVYNTFNYRDFVVYSLVIYMVILLYGFQSMFKFASSESYYKIVQIWSDKPMLIGTDIAKFSIANLDSKDIAKI